MNLIGWAQWAMVVGVGLALAGCSSDELRACDPLQSGGVGAAKLENVLGIGRADDGRFFVIDEPSDAEPRLFVSEDGPLVRRETSGFGSSSLDGIDRLGILSGDLRVLLERDGDRVRMAIVEGAAAADRTLDISSVDGEILEVLEPSAIADLSVRDLAADVNVEYSARVEGGERIVVIRPENDWSYEDFRLFFGPPDRLEEREVLEVIRARDGGSTHILFELGSETADVFFPNRIGEARVIVDEPVTLDVGSKRFEVERFPREAPELDDLAFVCLE